MYRNLLLIFLLASGLAVFLYLQPWRTNNLPEPEILDRLPEAHLIGKTDVLDLSQSLSQTLFFYKIPFRDFITPDFILSQGKNYGLDVQEQVYFFANHSERSISDWGIIMSVTDSSKVHEGINHLQNFIDLETTSIAGHTVYTSPEYNAYIIYGDNWIFFYVGDNQILQITRVLDAKYKSVHPKWKALMDDSECMNQKLSARIFSPHLEQYDVESVCVSLSNDSSSLTFNTSINQTDSLPFSILPEGPKYHSQEFTRRLINAHVDPNGIKRDTSNTLYKLMDKAGTKVSFPLDDFLDSWTGNVSFRQGGIQTIREEYIESELDENFNVTEVKKHRNVKISGFSLYLSMNENGRDFIKTLKRKGILTMENNKYRLLFSPPLNLRQSDSSVVLYTSTYLPKMAYEKDSEVLWTFNYTPISFYLDSTHSHTLFGRVQVPLKKIVNDYLPKDE